MQHYAANVLLYANDLTAVRVEMASPLAQVLGKRHERVSLVGEDNTPTVLVAVTSRAPA
jgi:hypothetical protein